MSEQELVETDKKVTNFGEDVLQGVANYLKNLPDQMEEIEFEGEDWRIFELIFEVEQCSPIGLKYAGWFVENAFTTNGLEFNEDDEDGDSDEDGEVSNKASKKVVVEGSNKPRIAIIKYVFSFHLFNRSS